MALMPQLALRRHSAGQAVKQQTGLDTTENERKAASLAAPATVRPEHAGRQPGAEIPAHGLAGAAQIHALGHGAVGTRREERDETPGLSRSLVNLTSVELLASSFSSFREVGHFHLMLLSIPRVRAVHLRRLQQGVLQVRVEGQSTADLLEALSEACESLFPFRIVSHEAHRLVIVFEKKG